MHSQTIFHSGGERVLLGRRLREADIPALIRLEHRQWNPNQAASEKSLLDRLHAHPALCFGTFCARTGEALTSLFMKPVEPERMLSLRSWDDCAGEAAGQSCNPPRSLFGISLTSVDPQALAVLESHVWPQVCMDGWRDIYLGSPMPGLRRALSRDPLLTAHAYAHAKRHGLPCDAQLRYYHRKGLRDIVAVLPGYFPHGDALDYGVLLRGDPHDIAAHSLRMHEGRGDVPRHSATSQERQEEAASE